MDQVAEDAESSGAGANPEPGATPEEVLAVLRKQQRALALLQLLLIAKPSNLALRYAPPLRTQKLKCTLRCSCIDLAIDPFFRTRSYMHDVIMVGFVHVYH